MACKDGRSARSAWVLALSLKGIQVLNGTNIEFARLHNERVVLEAIRHFEPVSRAEIARLSGLTVQTISNIVDELSERDMIESTGRRQGQRGQPARELRLKPDGAYTVGLDLNRDHITGVLVNLAGQVVHRLHYELTYPTPQEAIPLMLDMIRQLTKSAKLESKNLWGIGIATPGPIEDTSGKLLAPPDFPGWQGISLVEELGQPTGCTVCVEKDANAAAIGERWYGAGRSYRDFVYVYLGMGIGGGLILDGHPYRGSMGHAGEHGSVVQKLINLASGSDLLETPATNAVNLSILYRYLAEEGTLIKTPHDLECLFAQKHPRVLEWLEQTARFLVPTVLIFEDILDPEAIIFGGRLPEPLLEDLLERIRKNLPERLIRGVARLCRIERSQIVWDAACLGAASLPFFEAIAPHHNTLHKGVGVSR
jgi:predicted NBD/HSP70 family sugar kinase